MSSFEPPFETFAARYDSGAASLVHLRLVADLETPVSAYMKLAAGRDGRIFLLESVEGGAARGRYSMIGLDPDVVWRATGDHAEINVRAREAPDAFAPCPEPPLAALRALIAELKIAPDAGLPPMAAGIFGYLGYDTVRQMERLAPAKSDPIGVPDAILMRPTLMLVFDTVKDELWLVTPVRPKPGVSATDAYDAAWRRIDAAVAQLDAPHPVAVAEPQNLTGKGISETHPLHPEVAAQRPSKDGPTNALVADPSRLAALAPQDEGAGVERVNVQSGSQANAPQPRSNTDENRFLAMVARAKDYIRAGDIFQVVLSQRFSAPFTLPAFALYRALRRVNPAPFLCFLDFGGFEIVCSSPEILVRLRDGRVTIRPIAGTRARGATPAEDARLADELLADEKERAEHLMLLDLGRNDVGRVAAIGSVTVTEQFAIERYSHVMHIVSNVEGALDAGHDAIDALVAGFPAGTTSGAPKVRAMEIIDELETDKRGIYAGCIGYFGASGDMDTCIVLRTAVIKDGVMHVQAGAGIVFDSDPAAEHRECVNKAQALFRAAEEAFRFTRQGRRRGVPV